MFFKTAKSQIQKLPNYLAEHTALGKWADKLWKEKPKQAALTLDGASALFYLGANITNLAGMIATANPADPAMILQATEALGAGGITLSSALSFIYKQQKDYTLNNEKGAAEYIGYFYEFMRTIDLPDNPSQQLKKSIIAYTTHDIMNVRMFGILEAAKKEVDRKFGLAGVEEELSKAEGIFDNKYQEWRKEGRKGASILNQEVAEAGNDVLRLRTFLNENNRQITEFFRVLEFDNVSLQLASSVNGVVGIHQEVDFLDLVRGRSKEIDKFSHNYLGEKNGGSYLSFRILCEDPEYPVKKAFINIKQQVRYEPNCRDLKEDFEVILDSVKEKILEELRLINELNREFNPTKQDYEFLNRLAKTKQVWKKQLLKTFDPLKVLAKNTGALVHNAFQDLKEEGEQNKRDYVKPRYLDEFMGFTFTLAATSAIAHGCIEFANAGKDTLNVAEFIFREGRNILLAGAAVNIWLTDANQPATAETFKKTLAFNAFKKVTDSKIVSFSDKSLELNPLAKIDPDKVVEAACRKMKAILTDKNDKPKSVATVCFEMAGYSCIPAIGFGLAKTAMGFVNKDPLMQAYGLEMTAHGFTALAANRFFAKHYSNTYRQQQSTEMGR